MLRLCVALILCSFAVSLPLTWFMRHAGRKLRTLDNAGVEGQVKAPVHAVPNTGGVAIFFAVALPIVLGLIAIVLGLEQTLAPLWPALPEHVPGILSKRTDAIVLVSALTIIHVMGLVDDRRPLPAMPKLVAMLALALAVVLLTDTRLLTAADSWTGSVIPSVIVTTLWITLVTNAFNFLDNMDGLSGGVALVASICFLIASLVNGQWFVASCLALLIGGTAGFLVFNFPLRRRATIFMGDGGSLVVGFLLGFLTVRTTYAGSNLGEGWYAVFMPLVVLAVPLYDFLSVTIIRLSQGKSPFVGDLQHFSHRLVNLGLSQRAAVTVICALTGVTAIAGISLGQLQAWQASLVGCQTVLVLATIAMFEWRGANARAKADA